MSYTVGAVPPPGLPFDSPRTRSLASVFGGSSAPALLAGPQAYTPDSSP